MQPNPSQLIVAGTEYLAACLGPVDPADPQDLAQGVTRLDWLRILLASVADRTVYLDEAEDPDAHAEMMRECQQLLLGLQTATAKAITP